MHRQVTYDTFKVMQELAHHGVALEFDERGYGVVVTWDDGVKTRYETIWSAAKAIEATCEW